MLFKILKKDMRKRKGVNLILFLFITIATVFLASSVNNILVVSSAVEYYMDYANIPDVNIVAGGTKEQAEISKWLSEKKEVTEFDRSTFLIMADQNIKKIEQGKETAYASKGDSIYLDTADAKFCKVFDGDGKKVEIKQGEIAVSKATMERNDLKVGDKLQIQYGNQKAVFTVVNGVKDAAYGNDMVGMNRFIISQKDYKLFSKDAQAGTIDVYYIASEQGEEVAQAFEKQGFDTALNTVMRDTYKLVYSFDMIIAGILIAVGVCLILIAMLVLRFTLVFTLEEDYREIGIMKAVGFRDFAIKRIYLVKYFALVLIGSSLGLFVSIPVSAMMLKSVESNLIMQSSAANIGVNILCAVLVIALVMLFCYSCTGKLNKVSAISAIRNGQTGERFKKRGGIRLYKRRYMPVVCFLGINDVQSHLKRYLVLMITFCISFVLITIPLNTVTTMQSDEMTSKFSLDPESAVYVGRISQEGDGVYQTQEDLQKGLDRLKEELKEEGYHAKLSVATIYFFRYMDTPDSDVVNIMTTQIIGDKKEFQEYLEGTAPKLPNEIAFSKDVMAENNWNIGDTITAEIAGKKEKLIITGSYSDYLQLGKSARMNSAIDLKKETMMDYWNIMLDMETKQTQTELAKELKQKLPAYEWADAQTIVDNVVGGIKETLDKMVIPMTAMLCVLVMLITVLMEKLFVVREKGEIAMMKSIGFRNSRIVSWQLLRMVCVVLTSMVLAIPLSLLSNQFILRPIFKIMGADVAIQTIPWKVYGTYPGVLLIGIILATIFAANGIKKVSIQNQNNLE